VIVLPEDVDLKSQGYEITLTDKITRQVVAVELNHDHTKWVVSAPGFKGYYKTLETALKEALIHMQTKLGKRFGK